LLRANKVKGKDQRPDKNFGTRPKKVIH